MKFELEQWTQGLQAMLDTVLRHPDSLAEKWVLLIVAFVVCVMVLRSTGSIFGMTHTGAGRSFITSLIGVALMLLGLTAVHLFYMTAGVWIRVGAVLIISLMLVIPMTCVLLKGNYIAALFAWLISMGAVAGVMLMISAGFDAVAAGTKEAGKAKSHKHDVEQILGGAKESLPIQRR